MPRSTSSASASSASASKTMTVSQKAAFNRQFANFAPIAFSRANSASLTDWARAEARNFHHDVNSTVPFALTYNSLLAFAQAQAQAQAQQQTPSNTFAQDGQATVAELNSGQKMLNSILYREYNRWWNAFEAEAKEASDEMTAADRFSLHCARILRTKSGIPVDQITPIVGAWLMEKSQ